MWVPLPYSLRGTSKHCGIQLASYDGPANAGGGVQRLRVGSRSTAGGEVGSQLSPEQTNQKQLSIVLPITLSFSFSFSLLYHSFRTYTCLVTPSQSPFLPPSFPPADFAVVNNTNPTPKHSRPPPTIGSAPFNHFSSAPPACAPPNTPSNKDSRLHIEEGEVIGDGGEGGRTMASFCVPTTRQALARTPCLSRPSSNTFLEVGMECVRVYVSQRVEKERKKKGKGAICFTRPSLLLLLPRTPCRPRRRRRPRSYASGDG